MKVIIVGCGRLGINLANNLLKKNADISIIDNIRQSFASLPPDFQGQTIEGDALAQEVLLRAGIEKADALVAVTNCDPLNAVVAHVAQTVFHVPHIVVRNYDPRWRELHEMFGLQVISSTAWGAQRIEEMIENDLVRAVFSAGNGEVEVYEFDVLEKWDNQPLGDLISSKECTLVSLTRAGRAIIPTLDSVVNTGDVILFSATMDGVYSVRDHLAKK